MEITFNGSLEDFKALFHAPAADGHAEIVTRLSELQQQGAQIMGNITMAREALSALNETTNTMAAAVNAVVVADQAEDDAFKAEIADLKAQIESGKAVTAADLDELTQGMGGTKATLVAVKDALLAMGTSPSDPVPPVDIPPPVPPVDPPVEGVRRKK